MPDAEAGLAEFLSASAEFFQAVGGDVLAAFHGRRNNIEILNVAENEEVTVCCLEVEFQERSKFGSTHYLNAYEHYRQMRSDWWEHLTARNFPQWEAATSIIGHFVPYLRSGAVSDGVPYERESTQHPGQILIPYDRVQNQHSYYDDIHRRYGINWLLQDGRGITIGPDVGLLFAVHAALEVYSEIETFVDLGAGTGELSAFLIRKELARNIHINEYSPHLKEHLQTYLDEIRGDRNVNIAYQFTDASEFQLPPKAELVSMGIYYGAQPFFLERHGEELRAALGESGLLLIQSGMMENRFNISSLIGDDPRLFDWNWYDARCCLKTYFSSITSVFLADEIITMASNSTEKIAQVKQVLYEKFEATDPPALLEIDRSLIGE